MKYQKQKEEMLQNAMLQVEVKNGGVRYQENEVH